MRNKLRMMGPGKLIARVCVASLNIICIIWIVCSQSYAQGMTNGKLATAAAGSDESKNVLVTTICYLQDNISEFWLQHGFNPQSGAPVGTIGQNGSTVNLGSWTTDVGLVQSARHCYAFYNWAAAGYKKAKTSAAAEAACKFLTAKMRRQQRQQGRSVNDAPFVWSVTVDGATVTDSSSHLMGNWFAVLGLSQRALFHKSSTTKAEALAAFAAVDAWAHDSSTGGYSEASSKPVTDSFALPGNRGFARNLATHVTGIVALLPLFQATGDVLAKQRLLEMLDIVCHRLQLTPAGLWGITYQPSPPSSNNPKGQWVPVGNAELPTSLVRYGAQLQASWIVADAVLYMSSSGHMTQAKAQACTTRVMQVARKALEYSYDTVYGGVYELGYLPQSPKNSTEKLWFDQVEALQAMFWLNRTAASPVEHKIYSSMISKTLGFVLDKLVDPVYKEMFWSVDRAGTPIPDKYGRGLFKGSNWKATYHVGRFLVNFGKWLPAPWNSCPQQQQTKKSASVMIKELATRLSSA